MNFLIPDEGFPSLTEMLFYAYNGGKSVEATATGNPLVFLTDLARPLKSLLIPFTPKQSGTGDPSPENIRSILPWNGLTVFGGGKNLLNPATIRKQGNDNLWWYEQDGLFLHAGTYCFSFARVMTGFYVIDANTGTNLRARYNSATDKFTLTEDHFIKINVYVSGGVEVEEEAMLEAGSTATAYEPYKPITDTDIVFPSPVYGGTLDVVSGVLTVDFAVISKKWGEFDYLATTSGYDCRKLQLTEDVLHAENGGGNPGNHFCNCMIYSYAGVSVDKPHYFINTSKLTTAYLPEGTSLDTDVIILAKLATPSEIELTPAQITAIVGDNTIWSDADGQMTAVYLKKG